MTALTWSPQGLPEGLAPALRTLAEEYPLSEKPGGTPLHFRHGGSLNVEISPDAVTVTGNTTAAFLRGTGLALAGLATEAGSCPFSLFGVMIDCSRNAVMTVPYARKVLRRLALAGYNTAMLYTEDTYQLPDEPHFGFLRGAYSMAEIRELDDYAAQLGIELIGCIQTLGHLATFLKTAGAGPVKDTAGVLLAEEPATYALIEKMLAFWSQACRSRRIHVGMDETHDLGRGRYMDRNGFRTHGEIFSRHLQKVTELCGKYHLKPMIWSDMFFSMASAAGDYYDLAAEIPDAVRDGVPPGVDLVYWDYDHEEAGTYGEMIRRHRFFRRDPVVAAGIWTWYRLTCDHRRTAARVIPCMEACRENGISEFFFTAWGDDGAYCDFDTVFAALLRGAEQAYGASGEDAARLERFSQALHCGSYLQSLAASEMNWQPEHRDNGVGTLSVLLWDDPILGFGWRLLKLDDPEMRRELQAALDGALCRLKEYPYVIAAGELLRKKLTLQAELLAAYREGRKEKAASLAEREIPALIGLYERFAGEFRKQWIAHYKYNGMETVQVRIGGLQARCRELAKRLEEWKLGLLPAIPEWEVQPDDRCAPCAQRYQNLAAPGLF